MSIPFQTQMIIYCLMPQNRIHLNPANKGKFTAKAKRHNMSVQKFANYVLRNKERFPIATERQAQFVVNRRKFKNA